MKQKQITFIAAIYITSLFTIGCDKVFLEKKNDKSILVPTTLTDMRSVLDNTTQMFDLSPGMNLISGDEFTTTSQGLASITSIEQQNSYIWEKEIFIGTGIKADWSSPYKQVFYANIVLEGLQALAEKPISDLQEWRYLKGTALFQRGFAFYNLSQTFAPVYQSETATQLLGIPIRLSSDVSIKSVRSSLKDTYGQVLADLREAVSYLPVETQYNSRPTKPAAYALLSRIFLSMSDYGSSELYADSALLMNKNLLDYNTLDTTGIARRFPSALPKGNPEILFYSGLLLYTFPSYSNLVVVETNLYKSYEQNDLRRALFFKDQANDGNITFRGTYSGETNPSLFAGLSIDELYLIKAECTARRGERVTALMWLNDLLVKRYKKDKFVALTAATDEEALVLILRERKKELLARGLRWTDLRRLNLEPRFAITLKRNINDKVYELPPGDKRYVFPIPPEEVLGSGIQQNER